MMDSVITNNHPLRTSIWFLLGGLVLLSGCQSPHYADKVGAMGALAGGIAGAALGDHKGNAAVGALAGSAIGALAGSAIGSEIDRNNAIIEAQMGRPVEGAATIEDVVAMSQAGVDDQVIITHIRANGVSYRPQASDVIQMHNQGVSDTVINAMQQGSVGPKQPVKVVRQPAPVIVEEHYYGPPVIRYPARRHYHHRRRPGMSWGVSFHN